MPRVDQRKRARGANARRTRALLPTLTDAALEQRQLLAVTNLDTGATFGTIQAAVDAASEGDTILADPGVYPETVTVPKSLHIEGAQHGKDPRGHAFTDESMVGLAAGGWIITAANVTIDGFDVANGQGGPATGPGIKLATSASGARILNCRIATYDVGISLASDGVSRDLIQQCEFLAIGTNLDRAIGIESSGEALGITIDNNLFEGQIEAGIRIASTSGIQSHIVISNNQFPYVGEYQGGVFLADASDVQVFSNSISGAYVAGITLGGNDSGVTINGNTITSYDKPAVAISNELASGANQKVAIHLNRLHSIIGPGIAVSAGSYAGGAVDARDNWWGTNGGPSASGTLKPVGNVNAAPWLVMTVRVSPDAIPIFKTAAVAVDLTRDNLGATPPFPGHFPDGTPITMFAHIGMFSDVGGFTPDAPSTSAGLETAVFQPWSPGKVTITAFLDHETAAASLQVAPLTMSPATLADDTLGHPYHQVLSVPGEKRGFGYSVIAGNFPDGLHLDAESGVISGTPTRTGSFTFTIGASEPGLLPFVTHIYTVRINPQISFQTTSLPTAAIGAPYNEQVGTQGGTGALHFTMTGGSLPDGLALSSNGLITGTPKHVGASTFKVTATDSVGAAASETLTLIVGVGPTVVRLQRFGFHDQPNIFVLTFSAALAPASAQNLSNYTLVRLFNAQPRGALPLASATYNSANHTVTLASADHIALHARYRLTVNGAPPAGVRDTSGHFLAGQNGQSGTNYVQDFGSKILAGPYRPARNRVDRNDPSMNMTLSSMLAEARLGPG